MFVLVSYIDAIQLYIELYVAIHAVQCYMYEYSYYTSLIRMYLFEFLQVSALRSLLCHREGGGRQAVEGKEPGHEHGEVQLPAGPGPATGPGQPGAGGAGDQQG